MSGRPEQNSQLAELFLSQGKKLLAQYKFSEAHAQFQQLYAINATPSNLFWLRLTDVLVGQPTEPFRRTKLTLDEMKMMVSEVFGQSEQAAGLLINAAYNQARGTEEGKADFVLVRLASHLHPNLNTSQWNGALELEDMEGCYLPHSEKGSTQFILTYLGKPANEKEQPRQWIVQVFRNVVFPFSMNLGKERPDEMVAELQNWQAVNLKVPPKDGRRLGGLIETTWIVPKSLDITPSVAMKYGFADDGWRSIAYNHQPWPECFAHFVDQHAVSEIREHWFGPDGFDSFPAYRNKRVDR